MFSNFGWSTVGAEQNDPDTVNNLLFGHMEMTPTLGDLFPDAMDDSSSYGVYSSVKDDDSVFYNLDNVDLKENPNNESNHLRMTELA